MSQLNRLPPHPANKINRNLLLTFQFNGHVYQAFRGDTIASALWAAGVRAFTVNRNSLVQVNHEPNVDATTCLVEAGMVVKSQHGASLWARGLRGVFNPQRFYYKKIAETAVMWPLYETFLRHMMGKGQLPPYNLPTHYDKKEVFVEVLIIGGGVAGLSAALHAARKGAQVLLLEELPYLGGHLAHQVQPMITELGELPAYSLADQLAQQVLAEPNIQVMLNTTCFGIYESNQVGAVQQQSCLLKIQAKAVILANGAGEQPLLFPNNDLPGVLLASAAQQLLHLYGLKLGQRAVVLAANDGGLQVALDLHAAGVKVVEVLAWHENLNPDLMATLTAQGIVVTTNKVIVRARGHEQLQGVVVARRHRPFPLDAQTVELQTIAGSEEFITCDILVTSMGWRPATGLLMQAKDIFRYDEARPDQPPATIFAAGRVNGTHGILVELLEGEIVGREAAAVAGHGKKGTKTRRKKLESLLESKSLDLTVKSKDLDSLFRPISLGALVGGATPLVKYTPMHGWHRQWRAKIMTDGQWRRPEHYGNATAEALVGRRSVGLMDVSPLGKLAWHGADVPIVLARLYGEHCAKLAVGRAGYGVRCNAAGVVLDDAVVAHIAEDSWYLTTSPDREQAVYDSVISELQASGLAQVEVTHLTDSYAAMNLVGPQARLMLQPLTEVDLSEAAMPLMSARRGLVAGVSAIILRLGFMGELGYELHVPTNHALALWEKLMAAGVLHGIAPIGVEAQRVLRLERGHFILGQDALAWHDPFAADVTWGVRLEQHQSGARPSLGRWQAGRLTHKLVGFQMLNANIIPEEANLIVKPNLSLPTGFEIIGQVTSAAYSHNLKQSIGLCWLPIERSQVGAEFSVRVRGELHTGRVMALPFKGEE